MTPLHRSRNRATCRLAAPALGIAVLAACATPPSSNALPAVAGSTTSVRATGKPSFTAFTAGVTPGFRPGAYPLDLAAGKGGEMWFTDPASPAIGRISGSGSVSEFSAGLPRGAQPYSIVAGARGDVWFSDARGVAIGHATRSGTIAEYSAPGSPSGDAAAGITIGTDGTPWFMVLGPVPLIAHVDAHGTLETHRLPIDVTPDGTLAADAAGNLWYVGFDRRFKGVLVERTGHGTFVKYLTHMYHQEMPCCPHRAPKRLAIGPDGNPWFTTLDYGHGLTSASYAGTLAGGKIVLHKIRHRGLSHMALPSGMTWAGPELWITGSDPLDPDGGLWHDAGQADSTVYDLPYAPIAVAADRRGNPWFTSSFTDVPNQIVEVTFH